MSHAQKNEVGTVSTLSDEKIHDFVDGRLSPREAAAVAVLLALDPNLRRRAAELGLMNEMVRGLGQSIIQEPVPDRLKDILKSCAEPPGSPPKT